MLHFLDYGLRTLSRWWGLSDGVGGGILLTGFLTAVGAAVLYRYALVRLQRKTDRLHEQIETLLQDPHSEGEQHQEHP